MAIYVMLDAELHDADAYKEYMAAAPQYIERHGGEYLCRGGSVDVLVGDWYPYRVVMLKFPARENFDAFINDPDYQPWKELRESLTTLRHVIIFDGV